MYTDETASNPADLVHNHKRTKSEALITRIRQEIIAGLKPDTKLATFNEMERTLGVSRTVVREAVNQLKRDGFIYSVDRRGLFVCGNPPHLSRYGIVFPSNPSAPDWPRFHTAFQQEASALQHERRDITFVNYYDIARGPNRDSYEQLLSDLRSQRLAGVLLLPPGHAAWQAEPLKSTPVPKVFIFGARVPGRAPSVTTNSIQMRERMAQWLRERGRSRIAVVGMEDNTDGVEEWLREAGVLQKSHWYQTLGRDNIAQVRKIIALLMDQPAAQRPDGLMILDDNLAERAVGGLLECGVRIGQDIDVIAHCNWPWPVVSAAPIQRVGFHARHMLALSVRAVDLLRRNRPLAMEQAFVPALFESEVNQPWKADLFDTSME